MRITAQRPKSKGALTIAQRPKSKGALTIAQRPKSKGALTIAAALAAVGLALTGCSSGGGDATGASADKTITLGFPGGIGTTDVPAILALEALAEDGWATKYIEFDSPDVQTQALLRGDISIASMGPATVMAANIAGADLKIIANNNKNDLQIVVSPDINSCQDLDGKPVAYHSNGSTSTAHLKRWLSDTCPEANPEFLVISGSGNRATALLEGQIAGTIVRLEDWIPAIKGKENQGKILAALSKDQENLLTQTIVVTEKNAEANHDSIATFLNAMQEQFDAAYAEPVAFASKAAVVLGQDGPADLEPVYTALTEQKVFPTVVGIDTGQVDGTITFYQENGAIPDGEITRDSVVDVSFSK